jgi:hypothetical protein
MGWNAKALRNPNVRMTGVVYLLYFLAAILADFLVGRELVAYCNATNLIATAFYVVLTLLFYGMLALACQLRDALCIGTYLTTIFFPVRRDSCKQNVRIWVLRS